MVTVEGVSSGMRRDCCMVEWGVDALIMLLCCTFHVSLLLLLLLLKNK